MQSIIDCKTNTDSIYKAIKKATSNEFKAFVNAISTPFGDGNTSTKIEKEIIKYLNNKRNEYKSFFDVDFSYDNVKKN